MSADQRALASIERNGRSLALSDTVAGRTVSPGGLSTLAAFEALYDPPGRDVYGWGIGPTVNCWLSDLARADRLTACSGQRTIWSGWTMTYLPGRALTIKPGRGHHHTASLYDLSTFWPGQTSLPAVAHKWGLDVPGLVVRGENARPWEYPDWTDHDLSEYASLRATLIGQLASAVLPRLADHDLDPHRPLGVGSIGSRLLRDAGAKRWVARYRPWRQPVVNDDQLLDLMFRAYYGGRIELLNPGHLSSPLYRLDLRSAYLWALSHIGPLGFEWEPTSRFSDGYRDRMSIWHVSWSIPDARIGPFPYRESSVGALSYPDHGEGWYWWPEVRSALRVWGDRAITVHEGYISPRSGHRPFLLSAERLYKLRLALDAADDPLAELVKAGGNAVYGKLAQQRAVNGKVGWWYNPGLAGWITSAVRAKLLDAIGPEQRSGPATLATMTDGLLTMREPSGALQRSGLGSWKVERYESADLVQAGLYRLHHESGRVELAQTRLGADLDWEWLLDELTDHWQARTDGRWFVPHILADIFPDEWGPSRCRWTTRTVTVDPFSVARRRWTEPGWLIGLDWRRQLVDLGTYTTVPTAPSAPYRLPPSWHPAGYNALLDAAQQARRGIA